MSGTVRYELLTYGDFGGLPAIPVGNTVLLEWQTGPIGATGTFTGTVATAPSTDIVLGTEPTSIEAKVGWFQSGAFVGDGDFLVELLIDGVAVDSVTYPADNSTASVTLSAGSVTSPGSVVQVQFTNNTSVEARVSNSGAEDILYFKATEPGTGEGETDCTYIVTTDNGFAFKGPDTIVWDGDPASPSSHTHFDFGSTVQPAAFNDPQKIVLMPNYNTDVDYRAYSSDAGDTWTTGNVSPPSGYTFSGTLGKDGTYNWLVDEDGKVWTRFRKLSDNHRWLCYSTDHTMTTWVPSFDMTALFGSHVPSFACYITGGKLWWLDGQNHLLHRVDVDGTNHASFTIDPASSYSLDNYVLSGQHGTNRLVAWYWPDMITVDGSSKVPPILTIDITDPNSPPADWGTPEPFGVEQGVWDIAPLTNQIVIAISVDFVADSQLQGSIWRSTDGGLSWSNVVPLTTQLGVSYISAGVGDDNEIQAIAPDPGDPGSAYVGLCPPYVYITHDYGSTWSVDTVDVALCDAYGGDRPYEWMGISAVCTPGEGPPPTTGLIVEAIFIG